MSTKPRTVIIASDHAGYDLKEFLKRSRPDIVWVDKGPHDTARVDYPDYADRVSKAVLKGEGVGVLTCGSAQGMAIRANKFKGIRAALVWSDESAKLSREHNDANVLCLGSRLMNHEDTLRWLDLFLSTPFAGGRHADRVNKIARSTET